MGERIIVTDDDERTPAPDIIIVHDKPKPEIEKVVIEKTTVVEKKAG